MTVPLCTGHRDGPTTSTTVQAQVYLGPPKFTTISDDFDDSSSPSSDEYETQEDGLPLPVVTLPSYITSRAISHFTIDRTDISLRNPIDLFFIDEHLRGDLSVNAAVETTVRSMWPGANCSFKGGLLVVMRSHSSVDLFVNLPREHFDLSAFICAA